MLHRSRELQKYPKKVIWVYDVIGSYFVDQFYNHLYIMAKKAAEIGHTPNITDGYRANVLRYHHGICSNVSYYKQAVTGLHEYYQTYAGQGITTIADFEDQILTQFIPEEFYDSFTDADRNTALREIIVCIATTLCESVISRDILPKIIDNHSNTSNVTQLQQLVVSALCTRRDDYFVKFAKQVTRAAGGHNNVDIDTFNALKTEFINEKRARCDAESTAKKLQQMLTAAIGRIKSQSAELDEIITQLETAKKRNDELTAELAMRHNTDYKNQFAPQQPSVYDRGRQRDKTPYPRPFDNSHTAAVVTEILPAESSPASVDILGIANVRDNLASIITNLSADTDIQEKKPEQIGWGLSDELW